LKNPPHIKSKTTIPVEIREIKKLLLPVLGFPYSAITVRRNSTKNTIKRIRGILICLFLLPEIRVKLSIISKSNPDQSFVAKAY
jgi:hypothetical protein